MAQVIRKRGDKPPKKVKKPTIKALPKGTSPSDVGQAARSASNKLANIRRDLKRKLKVALKSGAHVTDYDVKLLQEKARRIEVAQAELNKLAA